MGGLTLLGVLGALALLVALGFALFIYIFQGMKRDL